MTANEKIEWLLEAGYRRKDGWLWKPTADRYGTHLVDENTLDERLTQDEIGRVVIRATIVWNSGPTVVHRNAL